jgi:hypothetical protein
LTLLPEECEVFEEREVFEPPSRSDSFAGRLRPLKPKLAFVFVSHGGAAQRSGITSLSPARAAEAFNPLATARVQARDLMLSERAKAKAKEDKANKPKAKEDGANDANDAMAKANDANDAEARARAKDEMEGHIQECIGDWGLPAGWPGPLESDLAGNASDDGTTLSWPRSESSCPSGDDSETAV